VRELRGPFPEIETIATGGVDATNARSFLDAGCVAVGVGGALVRATPDERRALVAAVADRP
jgi:2-dehydro-3-deoxyphosphogluconate aldolase/(4S)-4-hydroxy-2-oxoglutarate aldolase